MQRAYLTLLFIAVLLSFYSCRIASEELPDDGIVYFLVSEINPNHMYSYILPLKDPDDISKADNIIKGLSRKQIVVAKINQGSGDGVYLNRDLSGPGNRIWSWYVTEFDSFADVTMEILDGNPLIVENNIDDWIRMTDGFIGFWNYTITRRVNISEIRK
ncbi:MAG: hypothetical protein ABFR75_10135 [Acidobacteriota bacterium]